MPRFDIIVSQTLTLSPTISQIVTRMHSVEATDLDAAIDCSLGQMNATEDHIVWDHGDVVRVIEEGDVDNAEI